MIRYWKNKGKKDNEIKGKSLENMVDRKVAFCRTEVHMKFYISLLLKVEKHGTTGTTTNITKFTRIFQEFSRLSSSLIGHVHSLK